jgi:hypothetical protein
MVCDMSWREVIVGEHRWRVSPVVERLGDSPSWRLVLNCRPDHGTRRTVWAQTDLRSSSRSDLYAQADRLSDDRVAAVLAEHIRGS